MFIYLQTKKVDILLFIIIDYPNKIDPDYKQIVELLDDPKYKGHVYESNKKGFTDCVYFSSRSS